MSELPGGTVTFVFTDIEGSTRLLQELGDEDYGRVARDHRRIVREAFGAHEGTEIDTQGDAFFFSFIRARDAVAGAVAVQRALRDHEWPEGKEVRVRMGLHTGEPQVGEEGYLGLDVVRAARISAAGRGGQILVSETTRALLGNQLPEGVAVHDLGQHELKDVQHEHIYELTVDGRELAHPLLQTRTPATSKQEEMASRFEDRITALVERRLAEAFHPQQASASEPEAEETSRFEERITSYVERQLEAALEGDEPKVPLKLALGGAAVGFTVLLMLLVVLAAIALLVKTVFF